MQCIFTSSTLVVHSTGFRTTITLRILTPRVGLISDPQNRNVLEIPILRTYVNGSLGLKKNHHTQDRVWLPKGSGFKSSPPKNFARRKVWLVFPSNHHGPYTPSRPSRVELWWVFSCAQVMDFDDFIWKLGRGFTNPPIFFSHQNPPPDMADFVKHHRRDCW